MSYVPSVNIATGLDASFRYIATPNARQVLAWMIAGYRGGSHSFTIVGTYGTGKSSFLAALENDLLHGTAYLIGDTSVVAPDAKGFEFVDVVGDFASLDQLLAQQLDTKPESVFEALSALYARVRRQGRFLFILVDEFGKILEHAATQPEKELYFLQKLAEWVNAPGRDAILLTTLHQNFSTYSRRLSETQRNEWSKVKGRFRELVFAEPVEQFLTLASGQLADPSPLPVQEAKAFEQLYRLSLDGKLISPALLYGKLRRLYPLDPVSATCLAMAVQRYGQSGRTLFSFLADKGAGSIGNFKPECHSGHTYHLALLYDYLSYNFYSVLADANADSMHWRAMSVAVERAENLAVGDADGGEEQRDTLVADAVTVAKTVGMFNLFFSTLAISPDTLVGYLSLAAGVKEPQRVLDRLLAAKIIRFARYRGQYVLFEGTDIDLENALLQAASAVPFPRPAVEELNPYIEPRVATASAAYIETGTPRYFQFVASNLPVLSVPTGDIDGYVNLVFPLDDDPSKIVEAAKAAPEALAVLYAVFVDTSAIASRLYEIKKLDHLLRTVASDDRVAAGEIARQRDHEKRLLNAMLNGAVASPTVRWYFGGEEMSIRSERDLNRVLSEICRRVYSSTPTIKNELFNRQKLSSAVSLARVNLLDALLNHGEEEDLGFPPDAFPPEKTIYFTLLKQSGIHRRDSEGRWKVGAPTDPGMATLWKACEDFLRGSVERERSLEILSKMLLSAPYKLKQGVVDFWLPIFLIIRREDFALYHQGSFIPAVNREVLDLMQKHLADFSVKTFAVRPQMLGLFNQYRTFLKKQHTEAITTASLLETVKPFFQFYRRLNPYARTTRKFDHPATARFRDTLASAQDPAQAFLTDLPRSLGFDTLDSNDEPGTTPDAVGDYLAALRGAVAELAGCYDRLIERLEAAVTEQLGLEGDFPSYKAELERRYAGVDQRLLTQKTRSFVERVLSPSATKREFYEKISLVVLDKKLEQMTDRQEPWLLAGLLHLFGELERHRCMADVDTANGAVAYSFELASSHGEFLPAQTFSLPAAKAEKAQRVEKALAARLSNDRELNVCVLLKMLNDRVKPPAVSQPTPKPSAYE